MLILFIQNYKELAMAQRTKKRNKKSKNPR